MHVGTKQPSQEVHLPSHDSLPSDCRGNCLLLYLCFDYDILCFYLDINSVNFFWSLHVVVQPFSTTLSLVSL